MTNMTMTFTPEGTIALVYETIRMITGMAGWSTQSGDNAHEEVPATGFDVQSPKWNSTNGPLWCQ